MMHYKDLIASVREQSCALEPNMRKLVFELAMRLERVMESPAVRETAEKEMQALKAEPGRVVHILGLVWTIKQRSESEDENLKDCDGYCDWTTREIVVEREESGTLADMERYIRKVIRHEIIHAFLFESGLCQCSCTAQSWAMNEEMVDWLAHQGQQIYAAWKEAGALDEQ